jgi:hypothetical protein
MEDKKMRRISFSYRKLLVICAVIVMLLAQSAKTSVAISSSPLTAAFTDVDLNSEGRVLDAFVNDLANLDKKSAELGKKASLTRAEFDSHQHTADDLKRRLSPVQNALRQIITKLKAAGQWDSLDQIVLAKISDSKFQDLVRRDGFKKSLEEAASGLSNDANQISSPLDVLRNKVSARVQDHISEPGKSVLASRVVRVSYNPASAMLAHNLRCNVAWFRAGITAAFSGSGYTPTDRSHNAVDCYCYANGAACAAL